MFSASPSPTPPPEKTILRCQDIVARFGISRSKIYELMNKTSPRFDPSFPKPIRLSASKRGAVGWWYHELLHWFESRLRA